MGRTDLVLDTSVLLRDPALRSHRVRLLTQLLRSAGGTVVVPEVVLAEAKRKCHQEFERNRSTLAKVNNSLGRFGFPPVAELPDDDAVRDYLWELRRTIAELGWRVANYPRIDHGDVTARLLRSAKPFGSEGTGYRDFLIWQTVLEVLSEGDHAVGLLTANVRDFAEDGELHPDLRDDLVQLGIRSERVPLFKSFGEALTQLGPDDPKAEQALRDQILMLAGGSEGLLETFDRFLGDRHLLRPLRETSLELPPEFGGCLVDRSVPDGPLELVEVKRLNPTTVVAMVSVSMEANISAYVAIPDMFRYRDIFRFRSIEADEAAPDERFVLFSVPASWDFDVLMNLGEAIEIVEVYVTDVRDDRPA